MEFRNAYQDTRRAAAYDQLEFAGTYHLAFRDLGDLLQGYAAGVRALDFGCGTGRSTRFLQGLGYRTVGLDIASEMVALARGRDAAGDYRVIEDGDFSGLPQRGFDVVLSAFTLDNVPTESRKVALLKGLRGLLAPAGVLVNLVSTPEIYTHEWVSFTTADFPENHRARCGDIVRIITKDYPDRRPVRDILWPDPDYRRVFEQAGLGIVAVQRPLARGDEGVAWISETKVAPWAVYLLRSADEPD
jgi:SAM-dependent methyltransferase